MEKTSAENAQRQQELQQNLEAAEEERRQLAAKTAEQEEQLSILHRERDSLSQQLEQVQQALAASQDGRRPRSGSWPPCGRSGTA